MKRMLATLMVLSLSLALLAGCGSQGNTSGSGETGDTIVFKVAHVESSESFLHQSLVKWKEYVETETNGRVKVELYPNGELGGDDEVIEGIRMQNIHMSICSSSTLTTYDEKLGLLDLPFLFESVEGMDAAIRGELGDLYAQWMDAAGFYCMGFQYDGSRGLSNSVRPVSRWRHRDSSSPSSSTSTALRPQRMFRGSAEGCCPSRAVAVGSPSQAVQVKFWEPSSGKMRALSWPSFFSTQPPSMEAMRRPGSRMGAADWMSG